MLNEVFLDDVLEYFNTDRGEEMTEDMSARVLMPECH